MPTRSFNDANAFHRAMRRFIATKAGVAIFRPIAHRLDRAVTKLTGGRSSAASIVIGVPALMLTTIGAKSGEPRTVALFPIPHADGLAVIASNFGGTKHPAWYYNLRANPQATVSVNGDTWDAVARFAPPGERDEIWAKGLELYPGWRKYEVTAGDRHIEALVLSRT
jgi:deazaflavin-dependent oxidoreductase (nitroreductase family)